MSRTEKLSYICRGELYGNGYTVAPYVGALHRAVSANSTYRPPDESKAH